MNVREAVRAAADRARSAYPVAIGLSGIGLIVAGVWGLFGWEAGVIAAGLPFASFYVVGQALQVIASIPAKEG